MTYKPFPPMRDDESTVIDGKQARALNDHIERLTQENMKFTAKHGPADADEVEHYEACECCGNFHRMEQEADSLRAQPGKMKAGEITRNHAYAIAKRLCDAFNVQPSLQLEEFIREEMNVLAAAQPEPRPLRELVEDGFTNFWVWHTERGLSGHISEWRFTTLLQPSEKESFVRAIS